MTITEEPVGSTKGKIARIHEFEGLWGGIVHVYLEGNSERHFDTFKNLWNNSLKVGDYVEIKFTLIKQKYERIYEIKKVEEVDYNKAW